MFCHAFLDSGFVNERADRAAFLSLWLRISGWEPTPVIGVGNSAELSIALTGEGLPLQWEDSDKKDLAWLLNKKEWILK